MFAVVLPFWFHNVCLFISGSELLGSLIRILQFNAVCHQSRTAGNSYNSCIILYYENVKYISKFLNLNIQMLNILLINLLKIPFNLQDLLSAIVKEGCLTERSCVSAVATLVPQHITAVRSSLFLFCFVFLAAPAGPQ